MARSATRNFEVEMAVTQSILEGVPYAKRIGRESMTEECTLYLITLYHSSYFSRSLLDTVVVCTTNRNSLRP